MSDMLEQVVSRKTLPPYSGNIFLHQYDGKFLFGVQSITSKRSILQRSQGVNLKTQNSHNTVSYTWKNNPLWSSLQIFSQARHLNHTLTIFNKL